MLLRTKSRPVLLLMTSVLLVLVYVAYHSYQEGVAKSRMDKFDSDDRHVPQAQTFMESRPQSLRSGLSPLTDKEVLAKPQTQTLTATRKRGPRPGLSPLTDKEVLAKTQPVKGELTLQVSEMKFLRQVGINQTNGVIPDVETIKSWDLKQVSFFFHSYLDNVQLLCQRVMKMGDFFAWGNFVCDEDKFRPQKPCLAYTFREKAKDALFEDDVVRLYGCDVFLFSPGASDSLTHSPHVTVSRESLDTSSLTKIKTPIDVLKLDLGGGEWDELSKMAATGELSHIRQLVVSLTVPAAKAQQKEVIVQNLLVLKALQDAGFRTFRSILRESAEKVGGVYLVIRTVTYELCLVNTNPPARSPPGEVPPPVSPGEQDMIYLRHLKMPLWELPTWEEIQTLPIREVHYLYNRFLDNPTIRCGLMVKLGQLVDGGYRVCDDPPYRPSSPCLVYSFGIREDFSFDDDAARFYGCDVFSFDPSMAKSYRRYDKVTFYKLGIGGQAGQLENSMWFPSLGENKDWRIESFTDIKYLLGHENRTVDVFKIDPEGAEWPALADMARAGELATVRQLVVEFHLWHSEDERAIRNYLRLLAELARAGFRLFHSHMYAGWAGIPRLNNVYPVIRTITYEVSFVNVLFPSP